MSIDIEDWFHTQNFVETIPKDTWNHQRSIVEHNTEKILSILDKNKTKGTFFVLGWVAERYPKLIQKIYNHGHEIASHGYGHDLIYELTPDQFRSDVKKSKEILEGIIGEKVIGYRAPNFSITDWAIEILEELDFKYDSSWFPTVFHDRYGKLSIDNVKDENLFKFDNGLNELRLSSIKILKLKFPWSGGAYFRLIPYSIFERGVKKIISKDGTYNFYIHPWEFDPNQPKVPNMKLSNQFRQYTNTKNVEDRYLKLVETFQFQPISDYLFKRGVL